MKFSTDVHVPQRMNPTDFGDDLTFHLAPPAGQSFNLSSEISHYLPDVLGQHFIQTRTVPNYFGDPLTFPLTPP